MDDPKVIRLGTLSPESRDRILAVWFREQAKVIIELDPEDIDRARAWTEQGPTGVDRHETTRRMAAFSKVMRKAMVESAKTKAAVTRAIGRYDNLSNGRPAQVPYGTGKRAQKKKGAK